MAQTVLIFSIASTDERLTPRSGEIIFGEYLKAIGVNKLCDKYFVNQIFLFHAYIKLNGHVDSAAILGYKLPKQIEEQKAQLALRVKSVSLLKIYEHLLESELAIKKAPNTQKEVLLYSMLIKLQGYL